MVKCARDYTGLGSLLMLNIKIISVFALVLFLGACSSTPEQPEQPEAGVSEREFYESAQRSLNASNYQAAIEQLQFLEARFPFGRYAEQAQLELVFAYFKNFDNDAARAAAERFIRLHPSHPNVDYAYYLKGLASFSEDRGLFDRFLPTDPSKRDPGAARDSFADFSELLARYPDSRYAPDARKRMIYLKNLLANYEVHVAEYYLRRRAYVAAANRGRYILENFQQTDAVPDGLAIMVEAYDVLGLADMRDNALEVLAANHPSHPSLDEAGNFKLNIAPDKSPSLLNTMSFGLLGEEGPDPRSSYQRPETLVPEDDADSQLVEEQEKPSFWSKVTLGIFD